MVTITIDIPERLAPIVTELGDRLILALDMGIGRFAPISIDAYAEAVDMLTQQPAPETIAAFRFSEGIETRISELLSRGRAGELSLAEELELDRFSRLEERLQLVKARALAELTRISEQAGDSPADPHKRDDASGSA